MNKASKVFHIFAGIVGILMIPGLIALTIAGLALILVGLLVVAVYIFSIYERMNGISNIPIDKVEGPIEILQRNMMIGGGISLGGAFMFAVAGLSLIVILVGIVLAFIGVKKKGKAINILNIVFGVFGLSPFLAFGIPATAVLLLFIAGILAVILMLWNPAIWITIFNLVAIFGSLFFFLFSVLGGIFGLVQKKE